MSDDSFWDDLKTSLQMKLHDFGYDHAMKTAKGQALVKVS